MQITQDVGLDSTGKRVGIGQPCDATCREAETEASQNKVDLAIAENEIPTSPGLPGSPTATTIAQYII